MLKTSLPGDTLSNPATYSASYTHDVHGNMTSMPHLSSMVWDFKDQLREVDLGGGGIAWYVYDAQGTRLRKVIENGTLTKDRFYLDQTNEYYREYISGSKDYERETFHVMDERKRLAIVETKTRESGSAIGTPSPVIRYQFDNHLGSASLELDTSANIISYEEYHPFGTSSYRLGSSIAEVSLKRYRCVGKERDDESGLYYYGARYYAAWLCRFVSVDPLKNRAPSLTPYRYSFNNPIRFLDPNGMYETDGHYWTVLMIGLMLGIENAEELAKFAEFPDTYMKKDSARLHDTWANGSDQKSTHVLNGQSSAITQMESVKLLLEADLDDTQEVGRLLHRLGDSFAHSRMDHPHLMYGNDGFYTLQHAFAKEADGSETGTRPDFIYERPPLYKGYVNVLAQTLAIMYEKDIDNLDFSFFDEMAEYADEHDVSLIGIMNYEVAKFKGENEFYVQYAQGFDMFSKVVMAATDAKDTHEQHLQNTRDYLTSKGITYKEEKIYSEQTRHTEDGVAYTIKIYESTKFIINEANSK